MKYTFEELILHPIQLVNVQLVDMQLRKHIFINDQGNINRDITISTKSELIDERSGYADVLVEINTTLNEEPYYDVSITYRGICENHGDDLEAHELEYFLDVQAIKLIWPYFREILPGIMMKMGTECFDIPTIDVLKTVATKIGNE